MAALLAHADQAHDRCSALGPPPVRRPPVTAVMRLGVRALLLGLGAAVAISLLGAAHAWASTGPDVSNYQHSGGAAIDWNQVRAAGNQFAFVKATEGPSGAGGYYTNPYFSSDWAGVGGAGLMRGAYHFAQPQYPLDSAVLQARYFVSVTGTMGGAGDLPPVLDLEATGGLPPGDLATWTRSWLDEVQRLTGRQPIIYTGYYFWNDNVGSTGFGNYRLWMARYTGAPSPAPLPSSWSTWSWWQFTSSASVPGIGGAVDLSRFCCPDSTLAGLGASGGGAAGNPFGSLDQATRDVGSISVSGWAIDPDTTAALPVDITVDGTFVATSTAAAPRPDVGSAFPGWGDGHGLSAAVRVGPGDHRICASARNLGSGTGATPLGCLTVVGNPLGALDHLVSQAPGQFTVGGWATDPDTTAPISVDVYVDHRSLARIPAGTPRGDVGSHGYMATFAAIPAGSHLICTYAINVGSGDTNPQLGCATVTVLGGDPIGSFDAAVPAGGGVTVSGWALDPTVSTSIAVHVYVDLAGTPLIAAVPRPDVLAVLPFNGPLHGFNAFLATPAGRHQVCAYAIDPDPAGHNTFLGCAIVTVASGDPFGSLDSATSSTGNLHVTGWEIDPDTLAPVIVNVLVDGTIVTTTAADTSRPDVGAAFLGYGPNRGYDVTVAGLGGGTHTICTQGIDIGAGNNATNRCQSLVTSGNPFGSLDTVVIAGGQVALTGWTFDPDSTSSLVVQVMIDGVTRGVLSATSSRPDLAGFGYGTAHGFSGAIPSVVATLATPDAANQVHVVCAIARNVGPGADSPLGCRLINGTISSSSSSNSSSSYSAGAASTTSSR